MPSTNLIPKLAFHVHREFLDADRQWNPLQEGSLEGGLQVNVYGNRDDYLRLAEFIRAFAEIDSSADADFHRHFEGLLSLDSRTRLHLILRKDDVSRNIE